MKSRATIVLIAVMSALLLSACKRPPEPTTPSPAPDPKAEAKAADPGPGTTTNFESPPPAEPPKQ